MQEIGEYELKISVTPSFPNEQSLAISLLHMLNTNCVKDNDSPTLCNQYIYTLNQTTLCCHLAWALLLRRRKCKHERETDGKKE